MNRQIDTITPQIKRYNENGRIVLEHPAQTSSYSFTTFDNIVRRIPFNGDAGDRGGATSPNTETGTVYDSWSGVFGGYLYADGAATNEFTNPDFGTGDATDWTTFGGTQAINPNIFLSGGNSWSITDTGGNSSIYQEISLSNGESVTVSSWLYLTDYTSGDLAMRVRDVTNGADIESDTITNDLVVGRWVRSSVTATNSSGGVITARIYGVSSIGGFNGTVLLDQCIATKTDYAAAYFEGTKAAIDLTYDASLIDAEADGCVVFRVKPLEFPCIIFYDDNGGVSPFSIEFSASGNFRFEYASEVAEITSTVSAGFWHWVAAWWDPNFGRPAVRLVEADETIISFGFAGSPVAATEWRVCDNTSGAFLLDEFIIFDTIPTENTIDSVAESIRPVRGSSEMPLHIIDRKPVSSPKR